jgi:hypothetical protein
VASIWIEVSVTDDPAGPARIAPSRVDLAPSTGVASSWPPTRLAAGSWRRVRLAAIVHWQAARIDRELAAGVSPRTSDALTLRAHMITRRRSRETVARGLARALRSAIDANPGFTAAVAPNRREVLAARTIIETLERRLRAPEALTARGMAMLRELLTEPTSPLYRPAEPGALGSRLRGAAAALEPSDQWD